MSNVFLETFIDKPVRESSGARSANRFDFQKNWSLCELLVLHANNEDYLMVFEHHEDVVVFNSEINPSDAIFYQVKSKSSGNWTIGALTKPEDGDSTKSILSKLYSSHLQFPENVEGLVFISNQGLSTKLKNGDKAIDLEMIPFSSLSDKDKEKIHLAVEPVGQNYSDMAGLKKIAIKKTDLRPSDHATITKGKILEFFENLYPDREVQFSLVYKTFFDEIRRKTNCEKTISNLNELQDYKGISRSKFRDMVNTVLLERLDSELWDEANQLLASEGYDYIQRKKVRENWRRYVVDRMDVENELSMQFREAVRIGIKKFVDNASSGTFVELLKNVSSELVKKFGDDFNEDYINDAILYEAIKDDSISTPNSKPAGKTK